MRQVVADCFFPWVTQFEGAVDFPYLDVKCLVTTGRGNLIDPLPLAMALPWRHRASAALATRVEIADAWRAVKARTDLSQRGGMAFRLVTDLYLDAEAIENLCASRLAVNEAILRRGFPGWDDFPAKAQLVLLSLAWAMGAGKLFQPASSDGFPKLVAAVRAGDWYTAARECKMRDGAKLRNLANEALFDGAAQGGDPDAI